ncbi:hypothetical protein [Dyadobacter sediminis]|uniref:Uncharacterized protein n=1 Tax=Dyadobacter sediminis TaxID=1493691 RepID=A0A5R9KFJ8_9BACT|nr:hypothetical protein [Dyadobacter sediminis]TLU94828.1 hypothetical protein FEM55_11465 [Dyadobacter sediminis]GGB87623.1 hypothetical protein GCM10011325_13990 [Dyadobacter sediminis]
MSNGLGVNANDYSVNKIVDTHSKSDAGFNFTQSQADFLELVLSHGATELSRSLKLIHDLALYHSDISFNKVEKSALFDLKLLWESFEQIKKEKRVIHK